LGHSSINVSLTYLRGLEMPEFDQERRVDNLKPPQNSHTPIQTPLFKGITKSPVRSMMIVVYNGFKLVPTLWTWIVSIDVKEKPSAWGGFIVLVNLVFRIRKDRSKTVQATF
jgi:hypothetical protein